MAKANDDAIHGIGRAERPSALGEGDGPPPAGAGSALPTLILGPGFLAAEESLQLFVHSASCSSLITRHSSLLYSYLSATMGSTLVARAAGR